MSPKFGRRSFDHGLHDEENLDDFDSEDWDEKTNLGDDDGREAHQRYLEAQGDYTADWWDISLSYRESRNFQCENCSASFVDHKHLLHVHHMDHDKANNHSSNLIALCLLCHVDRHSHLQGMVTDCDRQTIIQLRQAAWAPKPSK